MDLGANKFNEEGFNDWKDANIGLCRHEESKPHKKAIIDMICRKKKGERVWYRIDRTDWIWVKLLEEGP